MVKTFRDKFYEKYRLDKDEGLSLARIARLSKIDLPLLKQVYNRGIGAHKTNPESVRNVKGVKGGKGQKMSKEQWAFGRVFGFVMQNPKQVGEGKPDNDLFKKTKKKPIKK
jgi:hypothetical protein